MTYPNDALPEALEHLLDVVDDGFRGSALRIPSPGERRAIVRAADEARSALAALPNREDAPEPPDDDEIMRRLSSDNPKARRHREETSDTLSSWACVPIRDVVEIRAAALGAAREDGPSRPPLDRFRIVDALIDGGFIEPDRDGEAAATIERLVAAGGGPGR